MSMNQNMNTNQNPNHSLVQVKSQEIRREMRFDDHVVLKYHISYPQFLSHRFGRMLQNINMQYQLQAKKFVLRCEKKLYKMAVDQYDYSRRNRLPVQTFEAQDSFTMTYNQNCALSLYMDRYEYLGGAHGNTERRSDTWYLARGSHNEVLAFFPHVRNLKETVVTQIIGQIEQEIESGGSSYFDDYEENVRQHFDYKSFYLTPKGVVFYFQQYDIAPYVSGIPSFLIPYQRGGATPPSCNRGWPF